MSYSLPSIAPDSSIYDPVLPIKKLMAAMVQRALDDAYGRGMEIVTYDYKRVGKFDRRDRRDWKSEAWEWIESNDDSPGSLLWCLDGLGISHRTFKKMLEKSRLISARRPKASLLSRALRRQQQVRQ